MSRMPRRCNDSHKCLQSYEHSIPAHRQWTHLMESMLTADSDALLSDSSNVSSSTMDFVDSVVRGRCTVDPAIDRFLTRYGATSKHSLNGCDYNDEIISRPFPERIINSLENIPSRKCNGNDILNRNCKSNIKSISRNGCLCAAETKGDDLLVMKFNPDGRTAWINQHKVYSTGMRGLHEEMCDFFSYVLPSDEEKAMRFDIIERLKQQVLELWPEAKMDVFGSFQTNLYLPTGDIDVVILCSLEANPLSALARLENQLTNKGIYDDIKLIKSSMPIVKFVDRETAIKVDVCWSTHAGSHMGTKGTQFIKERIEQFPQLPILVVVLKQFLFFNNLLESFNGGISSYGLILLVISYLQLNQEDEQKGHAYMLVKFLELYGRKFNYIKTGVRVRDGGSYFNKNDNNVEMVNRYSLLCIEDPLDPSNNVGQACYGMLMVREAFQQAFLQLREVCLPQFADSGKSLVSSNGSILGRILLIPHQICEYRELLHSRYTANRIVPSCPNQENNTEQHQQQEQMGTEELNAIQPLQQVAQAKQESTREQQQQRKETKELSAIEPLQQLLAIPVATQDNSYTLCTVVTESNSSNSRSMVMASESPPRTTSSQPISDGRTRSLKKSCNVTGICKLDSHCSDSCAAQLCPSNVTDYCMVAQDLNCHVSSDAKNLNLMASVTLDETHSVPSSCSSTVLSTMTSTVTSNVPYASVTSMEKRSVTVAHEELNCHGSSDAKNLNLMARVTLDETHSVPSSCTSTVLSTMTSTVTSNVPYASVTSMEKRSVTVAHEELNCHGSSDAKNLNFMARVTLDETHSVPSSCTSTVLSTMTSTVPSNVPYVSVTSMEKRSVTAAHEELNCHGSSDAKNLNLMARVTLDETHSVPSSCTSTVLSTMTSTVTSNVPYGSVTSMEKCSVTVAHEELNCHGSSDAKNLNLMARVTLDETHSVPSSCTSTVLSTMTSTVPSNVPYASVTSMEKRSVTAAHEELNCHGSSDAKNLNLMARVTLDDTHSVPSSCTSTVLSTMTSTVTSNVPYASMTSMEKRSVTVAHEELNCHGSSDAKNLNLMARVTLDDTHSVPSSCTSTVLSTTTSTGTSNVPYASVTSIEKRSVTAAHISSDTPSNNLPGAIIQSSEIVKYCETEDTEFYGISSSLPAAKLSTIVSSCPTDFALSCEAAVVPATVLKSTLPFSECSCLLPTEATNAAPLATGVEIISLAATAGSAEISTLSVDTATSSISSSDLTHAAAICTKQSASAESVMLSVATVASAMLPAATADFTAKPEHGAGCITSVTATDSLFCSQSASAGSVISAVSLLSSLSRYTTESTPIQLLQLDAINSALMSSVQEVSVESEAYNLKKSCSFSGIRRLSTDSHRLDSSNFSSGSLAAVTADVAHSVTSSSASMVLTTMTSTLLSTTSCSSMTAKVVDSIMAVGISFDPCSLTLPDDMVMASEVTKASEREETECYGIFHASAASTNFSTIIPSCLTLAISPEAAVDAVLNSGLVLPEYNCSSSVVSTRSVSPVAIADIGSLDTTLHVSTQPGDTATSTIPTAVDRHITQSTSAEVIANDAEGIAQSFATATSTMLPAAAPDFHTKPEDDTGHMIPVTATDSLLRSPSASEVSMTTASTLCSSSSRYSTESTPIDKILFQPETTSAVSVPDTFTTSVSFTVTNSVSSLLSVDDDVLLKSDTLGHETGWSDEPMSSVSIVSQTAATMEASTCIAVPTSPSCICAPNDLLDPVIDILPSYSEPDGIDELASHFTNLQCTRD